MLTILLAYFRPKLRAFVETKKHFTVLPTDAHLPLFRALCGGRYFDFMDLARVDQVTRLGVLNVMIKKGLDINIGGQFLQYRKPLKVFRRFAVLTKIIYWDEKFFYVEQKFEQDGTIKASGLVQACFRGSISGVMENESMTTRSSLIKRVCTGFRFLMVLGQIP
jgi:acyl-CoA thioesterase FadM